jgi:hypothetical protein
MYVEEEVKLADGLLFLMVYYTFISLPYIFIYGSIGSFNGFSIYLFFIEDKSIIGSFGALNYHDSSIF